ncbi:MAG: DoxX family protein [bacterium]|nr:DoxX family protein [bacterium]
MKCFCSHPQAKNFGLLMLRLAVGVVFIYHGWLKLSDIGSTTIFFENQGIPLAMIMAWVVALIEFVGGLAMLVGVWVRTVSLLLALVMIVALLTVHTGAPYAAAELPIVLLGATLAIHGIGAGDWRLTAKECVCEMKK